MAVQTFSVKMQGDVQVSTNFKVSEFKCKDGTDTVLIDVDFVKNKLQSVRDHFGKTVAVVSGYRTPAYNESVGGAANSYHMKGQAYDITISGVSLTDIAQYAESIGVLGIITYPGSGFVHLDSRTSKYFSNDGAKTSCTTFGAAETETVSANFNQHVHDFQWACNQDGIRDDSGNELIEDGIWGPKCNEAAGNVVLSVETCGKYTNLTSWVQCRVGASITGLYDNATADAVGAYQERKGLAVDKKAGSMTINQIIRDYL